MSDDFLSSIEVVMIDDQSLVRIAEAARALGCSRQWVHVLLSGGRLVGERRGHQWYVQADSLKDWAQRFEA